MKKIFISLLIVILVLVGLLIVWLIFKPNPVVYTLENGDIVYSGKINVEGYQKLINKFNNAESKPKTIVINSGGGFSLAGKLIGEFIYTHGLNVKVRKRCFSACANYIFPAGKKKTLTDDALIIFHGGAFQKNLFDKYKNFHQKKNQFDDQNNKKEASVTQLTREDVDFLKESFPELDSCFNKLKKTDTGIENCLTATQGLEKEFYEKIKVDPNLPYLGQQGEYQKIYKSYEYIGFYYSFESLKKLGLNNIVTPKDWDPSSNRRFSKVYLVDIVN